MNSFSDYFLFSALIVFFAFLAWCVWVAVKDSSQVEHALLRNYPLVGHMRYTLERLGKFFRQYWYSNDNEEKPFSRATRSQVYRMAKNISNVLSFGSTSDLKPEFFVNSMFPLEHGDEDIHRQLVVGKDCEKPFIQKKLISISGMSFGALSGNAISALSKGAAMAGITLNTGEGGRPSKYHLSKEILSSEIDYLEHNGGIVLQIGTANFGYRTENGRLDYDQLATVKNEDHIKWVQIKLSQGAKPGKGGILPGAKVTSEIAELRGVVAGKDCVSPSKNPECETPEMMLKTIRRVKEVTGKPVGIKLAIAKVDELRNLLKMAIKLDSGMDNFVGLSHLPSVITIDGGDGGTGAAPALFMESLAVPVRDILHDVHLMLVELNIRNKVALVASGKLVTAHDAAVAFAMGADWIETARGFMMALGCINALECYKDSCPVGIATQNQKLQAALVPEAKMHRVYNYAKNMEKELFDLALACGLKHPRDLTMEHLVYGSKFKGETVIARSKVA